MCPCEHLIHKEICNIYLKTYILTYLETNGKCGQESFTGTKDVKMGRSMKGDCFNSLRSLSELFDLQVLFYVLTSYKCF